jgi:hypothetical protein
MKLFLGFLILSSIGGMLAWKTPLYKRVVLAGAISLFVIVGYYFLNQI